MRGALVHQPTVADAADEPEADRAALRSVSSSSRDLEPASAGTGSDHQLGDAHAGLDRERRSASVLCSMTLISPR